MLNKMVKVSVETLNMLKEWQKDIDSPTLDKTISLSIGWAKSYNSGFLVSQVELNDRLNKLEGTANSNASWIVNQAVLLRTLVKAVEKMSKEIENLKGEKNE